MWSRLHVGVSILIPLTVMIVMASGMERVSALRYETSAGPDIGLEEDDIEVSSLIYGVNATINVTFHNYGDEAADFTYWINVTFSDLENVASGNGTLGVGEALTMDFTFTPGWGDGVIVVEVADVVPDDTDPSNNRAEVGVTSITPDITLFDGVMSDIEIDLPSCPTSAVVEDAIYLFGGDDSGFSDSVYKFDGEDVIYWDTMPYAVLGARVVVLGQDVYFFGGKGERGLMNDVLKYTPSTHAWTSLHRMPYSTANFTVFLSGDEVFCIGGEGDERAVQVYSIASDNWTLADDAPVPMNNWAFGTWNGTLYTFNSTLCYAFEPGEGWTGLEAYHLDGEPMAFAAFGNRIYSFHGDGGAVFDMALREWHAIGTGSSSYATATAMGDRIYLFGSSSRKFLPSGLFVIPTPVFDSMNVTLKLRIANVGEISTDVTYDADLLGMGEVRLAPSEYHESTIVHRFESGIHVLCVGITSASPEGPVDDNELEMTVFVRADQPPQITDLSGVTVTTGDTFEIRAHLIDDRDVINVTIVWSFDDGSPRHFSTSYEGGIISHSLEVPQNALNLEYWILAVDLAGLNTSVHMNLSVHDNDPPSIILEAPPSVGTGQTFAVYASVLDNIGVGEVRLVWSVDDASLNVSMARLNETYSGVIQAPDAPVRLFITVLASDASGNWNMSQKITVDVLDLTPPEIIHTPPTDVRAGEPLLVQVYVHDDIDIAGVYLVYSDLGGPVNESMREVNGTYLGQIETYAAWDSVTYAVYAVDTSGNWLIRNFSTTLLVGDAVLLGVEVPYDILFDGQYVALYVSIYSTYIMNLTLQFLVDGQIAQSGNYAMEGEDVETLLWPARAGDHTLTFRIWSPSDYNPGNNEISIDVSVRPPPEGPEVYIVPGSVCASDIGPEGSFIYAEIHNVGLTDARCSLSLMGTTWRTSELSVHARTRTAVSLLWPDAITGEQPIHLEVECPDDTSLENNAFNTTVYIRANPVVAVTTGGPISIRPGYTKTVLVNIHAMADLKGVRLVVLETTNATVSVETPATDLERGEVRECLLRITVPKGAGNVTVRIIAVSEEGASLPEYLEIAPSSDRDSKPSITVQYLAIGAAVTAGATGVGFIASSDLRKYAFLSLLVPMYSRLKKEKILDHEVRGVIYGYIIANPGEHYTAIKRRLKLNNGTLTYHLYVLERERKIKSVKDGKLRKFYPIGTPVEGVKEIVTHPTQVRLLDLISSKPGITPSELCKALKMKKQRVSYHINKLLNKELIIVRKEGRTPRYYLASQVMEAQCEHCGSKIEKKHVFCPFCGRKVG